MTHKLSEKADKLLEMAMPILEKITDDSTDELPERALDACTKMIELAHYLYEVCEMKRKMNPAKDAGMVMDKEMAMPGEYSAHNPY